MNRMKHWTKPKQAKENVWHYDWHWKTLVSLMYNLILMYANFPLDNVFKQVVEEFNLAYMKTKPFHPRLPVSNINERQKKKMIV